MDEGGLKNCHLMAHVFVSLCVLPSQILCPQLLKSTILDFFKLKHFFSSRYEDVNVA